MFKSTNSYARASRVRSVLRHSSIVLIAAAAACSSDAPLDKSSGLTEAPNHASRDDFVSHSAADSLRTLAAQHGIVAMPVTPLVRQEMVRLGQALLFDPILSGNRNMTCMTCHLPGLATGDARTLPIGEGGIGLGRNRVLGRGVVVPRNVPPLFNLATLNSLFLDGRVFKDSLGAVHTPANAQVTPEMAKVFQFGAISAVGMFPVTSRIEMRGQFGRATTAALLPGGNELAQIPDSDFTGIWNGLMVRLGKIPEYRKMFEAAYPGTPFSEMTFAHASNAMAGFMVSELTFTNSPWDKFLAGDDRALTAREITGGTTFMTTKCAVCHNSALFTDGKSRNVALAQFGPGEGNGPSGRDDFGHINVTGVAADKYTFRTSPLRNVELTGPYGHAGEFSDLRAFVDHYSQSDVKLANFDLRQIDPSLRGTLLPTTNDILATRAVALTDFVLTPEQIDNLTIYLRALTDPAARNLNRLTPPRVPSGLPVPIVF